MIFKRKRYNAMVTWRLFIHLSFYKDRFCPKTAAENFSEYAVTLLLNGASISETRFRSNKLCPSPLSFQEFLNLAIQL